MKKSTLVGIAVVLTAALAACGMEGSDGSSHTNTSGGGHQMDAPTITSIAKMGGALHVQWTNNTTGCDAVEGERKQDGADFTAAFSVPGDVDNKMDGTATADTTYTYRLRCKMGSDYSPYSNEMSANPVR
ncbi:MAG: hypothetical protein AB2A00_03995 [Myxococcota bacterium]